MCLLRLAGASCCSWCASVGGAEMFLAPPLMSLLLPIMSLLLPLMFLVLPLAACRWLLMEDVDGAEETRAVFLLSPAAVCRS